MRNIVRVVILTLSITGCATGKPAPQPKNPEALFVPDDQGAGLEAVSTIRIRDMTSNAAPSDAAMFPMVEPLPDTTAYKVTLVEMQEGMAEGLAVLAGRAGGQTLIGGTAAGNDLTLRGTSHATPGTVITVGEVSINPALANADTIIAGDTQANLIRADASADAVGIGTATPGAALHVKKSGIISLFEGTTAETQFHFTTNSAATPYTWMIRFAGTSPFFIIRDSTAGTEPFAIQPAAPSSSLLVTALGNVAIGSTGNLLLGGAVGGTGANKVLVVAEGTAPSTCPVDVAQCYVIDGAAGAAELFCKNELCETVQVTGKVKSTASDFSKTNDTTLANVTGLSLNVRAGETVYVDSAVHFVTGAVAGHKWTLSGTATTTSVILDFVLVCNATVSPPTWANGALTYIHRITSLGTAVGPDTAGCLGGLLRIVGTVVVNAAGTLTIQAAQFVSNATSCTVKAGSRLWKE